MKLFGLGDGLGTLLPAGPVAGIQQGQVAVDPFGGKVGLPGVDFRRGAIELPQFEKIFSRTAIGAAASGLFGVASCAAQEFLRLVVGLSRGVAVSDGGEVIAAYACQRGATGPFFLSPSCEAAASKSDLAASDVRDR